MATDRRFQPEHGTPLTQEQVKALLERLHKRGCYVQFILQDSTCENVVNFFHDLKLYDDRQRELFFEHFPKHELYEIGFNLYFDTLKDGDKLRVESYNSTQKFYVDEADFINESSKLFFDMEDNKEILND